MTQAEIERALQVYRAVSPHHGGARDIEVVRKILEAAELARRAQMESIFGRDNVD